MEVKRNGHSNMRKKIKYTYIKQKINRKLSLIKTEVCVGSLEWQRESQKGLCTSCHFQGWAFRILTEDSRLPHDLEASWKGRVWLTVTLFQGWDGRTSPSGSLVTCCLHDLVYLGSFWWAQRSHKSLSRMQNYSLGKCISFIDQECKVSTWGHPFPPAELIIKSTVDVEQWSRLVFTQLMKILTGRDLIWPQSSSSENMLTLHLGLWSLLLVVCLIPSHSQTCKHNAVRWGLL